MSEFSLFIIFLQIIFCVHVIKYDKDKFWLFIIILIPLLGCIIYFITQILPAVFRSNQVKYVGNSVINMLDPERDVRKLQDQLEVSDTIDNRLALAEAYSQAGQPEAAAALYEKCLVGIHENDPDILLNLAQAFFMSKQYKKAMENLDKIKTAYSDFNSHDAHLLYAKTLQALDKTDKAIMEYEKLANSYPGEEARVRYGLLLKETGNQDRARELFRETLTRIKRAPKFYLKKEKHWIEIASDNLE